jgi:ferredoxin
MEPKLFQIGLESYVELIDTNGTVQGTEYTFEATEEQVEMTEEAAESCPTRSITVTRS